MPDQSKNIEYKDYNQAVRASYKLGVLDGRTDIQNQLEEMQRLLGNMLETNKHLFQLLQQAGKGERAIKISPCFTIGILGVLAGRKNRHYYIELKKKYELATGKKYGRQPGANTIETPGLAAKVLPG